MYDSETQSVFISWHYFLFSITFILCYSTPAHQQFLKQVHSQSGSDVFSVIFKATVVGHLLTICVLIFLNLYHAHDFIVTTGSDMF